MAKSKFFSLWGQKAEDKSEEEKPEDQKPEGEEKKPEETAQVEDGEDDEEDEDEEMAKAVTAVPGRVARHIRRAERRRLHAIVDGAGPAQVGAALHVALNTDMDAETAVAFVKATPAAASPAGALGLAQAMTAHKPAALGPDAAPAGKAGDADTAAAFILKAGKA